MPVNVHLDTFCQVPRSKITQTPSRSDGVSADLESKLRIAGCELIQSASILLKLPHRVAVTAQILFQRFYYCKSFIRYESEIYGMACLCLSAKLSESPRYIRDILNVFNHIIQMNSGKVIAPVKRNKQYIQRKNSVIVAEARLLKNLGFCVFQKPPHHYLLVILELLGLDNNRLFVQTAWNSLNDALHTDVCVKYPPESIAVAGIFLAGRMLNVALPLKPIAWYTLFNISEERILEISKNIYALYRRKKINVERLQRDMSRIRRRSESMQSKIRRAKLIARRRTSRSGHVSDEVVSIAVPSSHRLAQQARHYSNAASKSTEKKNHSRNRKQ